MKTLLRLFANIGIVLALFLASTAHADPIRLDVGALAVPPDPWQSGSNYNTLANSPAGQAHGVDAILYAVNRYLGTDSLVLNANGGLIGSTVGLNQYISLPIGEYTVVVHAEIDYSFNGDDLVIHTKVDIEGAGFEQWNLPTGINRTQLNGTAVQTAGPGGLNPSQLAQIQFASYWAVASGYGSTGYPPAQSGAQAIWRHYEIVEATTMWDPNTNTYWVTESSFWFWVRIY